MTKVPEAKSEYVAWHMCGKWEVEERDARARGWVVLGRGGDGGERIEKDDLFVHDLISSSQSTIGVQHVLVVVVSARSHMKLSGGSAG